MATLRESSEAIRESAESSRDDADNNHGVTLQAIEALTEQLTRLIDVLASNTPTVNVEAAAPSELTLTQQPVTVNVPESPVSVQVAPGEVILRDERKPVNQAIIHHSDGTQSRIEFKKKR